MQCSPNFWPGLRASASGLPVDCRLQTVDCRLFLPAVRKNLYHLSGFGHSHISHHHMFRYHYQSQRPLLYVSFIVYGRVQETVVPLQMFRLNCHIVSISLTIFMMLSKTAQYHSMATAYELTGSKAIVGSGISGLWLARLLTDAGKLEGVLLRVSSYVLIILQLALKGLLPCNCDNWKSSLLFYIRHNVCNYSSRHFITLYDMHYTCQKLNFKYKLMKQQRLSL